MPRRFDGDANLLEVPEGFQHQHVRTALDERRGLLGEGGGGQIELRLRRHAGDQPDRSHGAGDPHVLAGRLAGEPRAREVERAHLVAEAVAVEPEGVRAERVGLDDVRAGVDVVLVDLGDHVRPGDVELLEVLHDEDAALVEERAHGAVEHQERAHRLAKWRVPPRWPHTAMLPREVRHA